ncbi:MAG: GspH/FimT family pseudopilin [Thermodesulfovibrionales bacterium]
MREKGATFIELSIVLGVVGALIAATAFAYQGWIGRYKVEKATCELYTDLMRARLLAMQTNRYHFAVLNDYSYSIVEDTNETGRNDSGDRLLPTFPKPLDNLLHKNNSGNGLTFDKHGMILQPRTVWFDPSSESDYDCMTISHSRIIMGRYDSVAGDCIAK